VGWFPVLWPERCAGIAASVYQVPIDHVMWTVSGWRRGPHLWDVIARKAGSMRRSSVRGSHDEMAE
jgi:hypothetical protein